MSASTQIVVVLLLAICTFAILDISEKTSVPQTEEQAKAQILLEKHKAEIEQKKQQKIQEEFDALKAKTWEEVGFSEDALMKFIAHGYYVWLMAIAFFMAVPTFLMKQWQG